MVSVGSIELDGYIVDCVFWCYKGIRMRRYGLTWKGKLTLVVREGVAVVLVEHDVP